MTILGQVLRQARKARGLSQEALAAQLGVVRETVRRWESGEVPIPTDRVQTFLDAVDASSELREAAGSAITGSAIDATEGTDPKVGA